MQAKAPLHSLQNGYLMYTNALTSQSPAAVPVSTPARTGLLPPVPGAPPGPQAAEPTHQPAGRAETGRLRARPRQVGPHQDLQ